MNNSGPQYDESEIELGQVATVALTHGAKVHFIDLAGKKNTWQRAELRDAHAAERFNAVTAHAGWADCLVLYGAVHLLGDDPYWYRSRPNASLGRRLDLTSFIVTERDTAQFHPRP